MNRTKEIWALLEAQTEQFSGLNKIRYSDGDHSDLYLAIKYPEIQRLLLLRTDSTSPSLPDNRQFKGLKLEKIYDTSASGKIFISLVLTEKIFTDIFDTIIADITEAIFDNTSLPAVNIFVNRLEKWYTIFEQYSIAGLSKEEQCGLYGELFVLRKMLTNISYYALAMKSWTGPQKSVHDFQYGSLSIEVKTTTGNNHQKIQISNERQLDTSNTKELFLFHLSLETKRQAGETLNAIIENITSILKLDFITAGRFKTLLTEAGYFDHHRHLYDAQGYIIRQEAFYKVQGKFPRIEEKDIRKGVGDIKYSIIASQFSDYAIPESDILKKIFYNEE